jgi:hypothetical protein
MLFFLRTALWLKYVRVEEMTKAMPVNSIFVNCSPRIIQARITVAVGITAVEIDAITPSTRCAPKNQNT